MEKVISRTAGEKVAKKTISHMRFDAICWIIIAVFQILFGIPFIVFFGYGITMISCGAWNIYASVNRLKNAKYFESNPRRIYPHFEGMLNSVLISITINVIFGGVIGVIGGIYDLLLRNYVMNHKEDLKFL